MTPANQMPAAPSAPPFAAMVVGMVAQFLGPQGSGRRMLFGLAGAAVLALNHKLVFGLDYQEQCLLAGVVLGVVAASNTKETLVSRAQLAGQTAIMVAQHQANAQIMTAQAENAPDPAVDEEAHAAPTPPVAPAKDALPTPPGGSA